METSARLLQPGREDATLSSIEGLGGRRVVGPMDVPSGPRLALFSDPEGHVVGLTQAGSGATRS